MTLKQQIRDHLTFIYGPEIAGSVFEQLLARLADFRQRYPALSTPLDPAQRVTEADAVLITYGDQVQEPGHPALQSLAEFLKTYLKDTISSVHLLPFYPYSSDDGFSVIDYTAIDPALGDWADVALIGQNFRLMFDAVINHISVQSAWFQGFLQGDKKYADVAQGAEFIRLDAIAYLWKEIGTSCIHLPQTHRGVQLFRAILDLVAPRVMLITETNVPHAENISYFGDGRNEAQMVYQFSLAPLILHTFHTGNAAALQRWAAGLEKLPETAAFFNFIASHDGIGVRPAEGILTPTEIQRLIDKTLAHRGQVSYKTNPNGAQSAYELNITLFDALSDPNGSEPEALRINRFMASQAIMLAMAGVPGIYVHSLVGSANDYAGVASTGRARSINRHKWQRDELETMLNNPASRAYQVLQRYVSLLKVRAGQRAFHPNGEQDTLAGNPALFCLLRTSPDREQQVLCLHNISAQPQPFETDISALSPIRQWRNLLSGESFTVDERVLRLTLQPYEVKWLTGLHRGLWI
ncbi:MAG: alpha-glucosidase C-terminal domain-containing protein [Chloroflexi bacterium]|nr:alpha-glucosidase C-terminal domain-containing protein [Chloroflexota bacterium]